MKKGFTIVELAIVLVVIGIILGMAVKGKALVDAARMKASVAQLNKFEAASAIFYADRNGKLPETTNGIILSTVFINDELLTNADFAQKIDNMDWALARCASVGTAVTGPYGWNISASGDSLCVIGATQGTAATTTATAGLAISDRLVCNIEAVKDDENLSSGEGRGWGTTPIPTASNYTAVNYGNCDNLTSTKNYAYKVF